LQKEIFLLSGNGLNGFQQRCYMASVSAQQHCFEYVTSTEVNNMLWFRKMNSLWFI